MATMPKMNRTLFQVVPSHTYLRVGQASTLRWEERDVEGAKTPERNQRAPFFVLHSLITVRDSRETKQGPVQKQT